MTDIEKTTPIAEHPIREQQRKKKNYYRIRLTTKI